MKKKVLSLLLAVCLIAGMLPLAASAATGDNVPNVSTAILHDPTGGVDDGKLYDNGSYKVTATEGENGTVDVAISADNLQKHAMGGEGALIAYWCGFAVVPKDDQQNVAKMKVASGSTEEEVTQAFNKAEAKDLQANVANNKSGFAAYLNAGSQNLNGKLYRVQWFQQDGTTKVGEPVTYKVDLKGVKRAPETEVLAGKLHDDRTEDGIPDDQLYTSYDVTSQQKLDAEKYGGYYTEVSVAVKDLKEHQNSEKNMGHWAGMFAVAPQGAKKYKYAFGANYSDIKNVGATASNLDTMAKPNNGGNVSGIGAYADIGEPGPKTWLKVQWLDENDKALNTTVYHMDFSQSTVSSDADAPAPEYTSETATGVLEDRSGAVAKERIATGYTLTRGNMMKDTTTGKYYQEVTVSADTLKPQQNSEQNSAYWMGFAVVPADTGVNKMKYGTGNSMSELALSGEKALEGNVIGQKSGVAFYANMDASDTRTLWGRVQWLKDQKVVEENIYKINFKVDSKETVGLQNVTVYNEAGNALEDGVSATVEGTTITLSGVKPATTTKYTLKYTTTAGGTGSTKVTYDGTNVTDGKTFKVLNTDYTVAAGFATMPEKVAVATNADPAVNVDGIAQNDQDAVKKSIETTTATGLQAAAANVAGSAAFDAATVKTEGEAALKAANVTVSGSDAVHVYVQPYLDVTAESYDATAGTMAVDIAPQYQVIASTANSFDQVKLDGGQGTKNAVVLDARKGALELNNVQVSIKLPDSFAQNGSLYVKHYEHFHEANVQANVATFTTESFSSFTFDKNAQPQASIDGTFYATLQEAVEAVENGGVINVEVDNASATVSKEITFKTTGKAAAITAGDGYVNRGTGTEYKFVVKGGEGPFAYSVTVNATENGTVTANPTGADKGETVTLTVAPAEGYMLSDLTVKDASENTVATTKVSDTEYTFVMPESNVTVSATFAQKSATLPFTDVNTGDWWYEAVKYVYENKLMAGTSDTTFEPTAKLNRAQAVQLLYNLEGQPEVAVNGQFTDVSEKDWFAKAVAWAAENNVVAGVGNGKFDPNANVTREAFAQMMYNYAKFKGYDLSAQGNLNSFSDVSKVSDWAVAALTWANGEGLVNGNEDGTLAPIGTAIRGQAASIMAKFDQNVAVES